MTLPALAVLAGLLALTWSADRFVDAAAGVARHLGISALVIGMVVVGFGTSAPEMLVSAVAAWQGNPGVALGNAYGSNIANIGLILGVTALLAPIAVHSQVLKRELPILVGVTAFSAILLFDGGLTRLDAGLLGVLFAGLLGWTLWQARCASTDTLATESAGIDSGDSRPLSRTLLWLAIGLTVLLISSRVFVWGAVEIADALGVSDLVIGLTVVAIGTSLPELAASIAAVRRGAHDFALGNIVGSNLFNTLVVVGIAAGIAPIEVPPEVLTRDVPLMAALTIALLVMCVGRGGRPGRINRVEGGLLLAAWTAYTVWLISTGLGG